MMQHSQTGNYITNWKATSFVGLSQFFQGQNSLDGDDVGMRPTISRLTYTNYTVLKKTVQSYAKIRSFKTEILKKI